ncbi:MAG TPA: TonB-dependent receptor [Edaphobacter sp.]
MRIISRSLSAVLFLLLLTFAALPTANAQETTAAVQGTVTDPTGAVVPNATVTATSNSLIKSASTKTDSHGFYRLNALPPGSYMIVVDGSGMSFKATDLKLSAGDLPNFNIKLTTAGTMAIVDVNSSVAMVDVTQSKVETVINKEQIAALPKSGRSFQSVLTLAPGVRQEPLGSLAIVNGSSTANAAGNANIGGGSSRSNGFQVDGASDSENLYLMDGVNITNIQGGGIGLNVPGEFFQQVSIKNGAIDAQYGGALGGVINVIPERGTSSWHGGVSLQYRSSFMDANDQCAMSTVCFLRYDPATSANSSSSPSSTGQAPRSDATAQYYIAKQDHYRYVDPSFQIGGPLVTDKLFMFASYAPDFQRTRRDAVSTYVGNAGPHSYYNSADTHAAVVQLDYSPTAKLHLFAGWDYNFLRIVGQLPNPDSKLGQTNTQASTNPANFRSDGGFVNPISVYSFGADYTLGSRTLITARYGYMFNNTHSLGAASGLRYVYQNSASGTTSTLSGTAIPTAYQNTTGFANISANQPTFFNTYTRKGLNFDISHLRSGWAGTHNFKGGYQFVRTGNNVKTIFDYAQVLLFYGSGQTYSPGTNPTACDAIIAANKATWSSAPSSCTGNYGYYIVRDGTDVLGKMNSNAHGFYVQDDWTVGHTGLTINAGVRFDREYMPPYVAGDPSITFGWGSKIAPRIGGAYDLLHNGKFKLFASYGKYFDILKFSLPQGSFGGNYWHDCAYTLDNPNFNLIVPTAPAGPDGFRHSCPTTGSAPGVGSNAVTDTMATGGNAGRFIENLDFRAVNNSSDDPGVDPNIKPTAQHEVQAGAEYAMTPSLSFSTRYVRKALDSTTEDMGLNDTYGYYIGNPGSRYGDLLHRALPNVYRNAAINGTPAGTSASQFLDPQGICPTCPTTPAASRVYNGLEFRVEKRATKYQVTAFYTYSRLYGNYPGLTSTFITDGAGGRHNPNNNRSFDNPTMQFTAAGKPFGGPLPTDRPHSLTLFGFYRLKTLVGESTFGLTQIASSGTPISTCLGNLASNSACQFVEDQGHFVNLSRDAQGVITKGSVDQRRSPAFTQTAANIGHYIHVSKEHENRRFGGEFNVSNLFNQHAIEGYNVTPTTSAPNIGSTSNPTGTDYHQLMTGYDYMAEMNGAIGTLSSNGAVSKKILSSQYNLPNTFQTARSIRWKLAYVF